MNAAPSLGELVEEQSQPSSVDPRSLVGGRRNPAMQKRRRESLHRLTALDVEQPPGPMAISRELEAVHELVGIYDSVSRRTHIACLIL